MEFSYRDLHYVRNALQVYISHLESYDVGDSDLSEDEFSEMQDDIMLMHNLLDEVEHELKQLKANAPGGPKLETKPDLRLVPDKED